MKDLFKVQRMWPSFIGAKDVQRVGYTPGKSGNKSSEEHLLPVLLWPEQKRYLALQGLDAYGTDAYHQKVIAESEGMSKVDVGKNKTRSNKKRKRDDVSGEKNEEETTGQPLSAPKRARLGGFLGFLSSAFSPLMNLLSWRKKMTNADAQLTIFSECHNRKYFIGPGHVYGGDFNIYKGGDPSNSHSTATVRVVRRRSISGRDLLSFSRVQNQVAKSAVLAFVDPLTEEARFLVANFQNVSERL